MDIPASLTAVDARPSSFGQDIIQDEANLPLGSELTSNLLRNAAEYYDGEGGCHGFDHTERVHQMALYIGKIMRADLKILSAAAILHDIGRIFETREEGRICHADKGAELARGILTECRFTEDDIERIVHCVKTHRFRGVQGPVSLEAKILFDADKLDSIGATGIGRAFLFAGQLGARLHNRNGNIEGTRSYSSEDTAYREFKVKMCKIKNKMLTSVGRQLAEDRHAFMELFFERLEMETCGKDGMRLCPSVP